MIYSYFVDNFTLQTTRFCKIKKKGNRIQNTKYYSASKGVNGMAEWKKMGTLFRLMWLITIVKFCVNLNHIYILRQLY